MILSDYLLQSLCLGLESLPQEGVSGLGSKYRHQELGEKHLEGMPQQTRFIQSARGYMISVSQSPNGVVPNCGQ